MSEFSKCSTGDLSDKLPVIRGEGAVKEVEGCKGGECGVGAAMDRELKR